MRAIVRQAFGGPQELKIREVAISTPGENDVRIRVKAFGINRAELYMRRGSWGDVNAISGIECVGEVDFDPSGVLKPGQRVAAIMGGLGRTRPGSYAEYTCAPRSNVFAITADLSWSELAAIPESFATAWWCLFKNLGLNSGQTLLVRGGASALGRAAISLGASSNATVIATTRSVEKIDGLKAIGAHAVIVEGQNFKSEALAFVPRKFDRVLELIGNSGVRDSLQMVRPGGALCLAGFLGGMEPIKDFNPIADLPSDVKFSFFGSFTFGTENYATHDIPMQAIVDSVVRKSAMASPARVLPFEAIADAHRLLEANDVEGKVVVEVG